MHGQSAGPERTLLNLSRRSISRYVLLSFRFSRVFTYLIPAGLHSHYEVALHGPECNQSLGRSVPILPNCIHNITVAQYCLLRSPVVGRRTRTEDKEREVRENIAIFCREIGRLITGFPCQQDQTLYRSNELSVGFGKTKKGQPADEVLSCAAPPHCPANWARADSL